MSNYQTIEEANSEAIKETSEDCIMLNVNLLTALGVTKGAIASWILQHSVDGRIEINLRQTELNMIFSETTINRVLSWLVDFDYLYPLTSLAPHQILKRLRQKPTQDFWSSNKVCEWCQSTCLRTHHHHYPIQKSKGGTEIVKICPGCHDEFHYLASTTRYKLMSKLLKYEDLKEEYPSVR